MCVCEVIIKNKIISPKHEEFDLLLEPQLDENLVSRTRIIPSKPVELDLLPELQLDEDLTFASRTGRDCINTKFGHWYNFLVSFSSILSHCTEFCRCMHTFLFVDKPFLEYVFTLLFFLKICYPSLFYEFIMDRGFLYLFSVGKSNRNALYANMFLLLIPFYLLI